MQRWINWWKRLRVSQDEVNRRAREEDERYQSSWHIVNGMKIEAKEKQVRSKYIDKLLKESSYLMPLRNIKKKFYWLTSIFQQTECMICLKEFDSRSKCRIFSCFHFFHDDCIQKWFLKGDFSCPYCKTNYYKLKKGQFDKAHFKQKLKHTPELDIRSTYSNQIRAAKKYKVTQADLNEINKPKTSRGKRSSSLDTALTKKYDRSGTKKLLEYYGLPLNHYADSKTRAIIKLPGKLTTEEELDKSSLYLDQNEFMSKVGYNILKEQFQYELGLVLRKWNEDSENDLKDFIWKNHFWLTKRTKITQFNFENLYEEEE